MMSWIQITSGRGPEECCWVVFRLSHFLMRLAGQKGQKTELIEAITGDYANT